ncbi:sugar transferase [Kriegella aquimaris]|uniref:Sugar transferase involved in LPS biosynthesis (Colanic, teichoic acid) n=1 Tax=Kriegella aquimaris TaxID=192904 RepID=A0A1G9JSQ2_9FLAO|nr:sugar transferase [Kriegella aquimaris]SDL39883.1 Sugar transferase involved in LPS biosynthesis (colanic, teichoic acid) [Kriegella aquimaris]
MYKNVIKNILDLLTALIALVALSPLFIGIVVILGISNNGKPFFVQKRPGKNGRIFKILKFKTMNDKKGPDGQLLSDHERMTKIGKFIRKTSLDEIPQLLNVIRGDMSIVGPRPLLVSYLPLYNEEQARRHDVKPGITGWAQINGRNAISWEDKFKYDVWYVRNISFLTDLKILWKTVGKVFNSEGVSASEEVTMELFRGSKN